VAASAKLYSYVNTLWTILAIWCALALLLALVIGRTIARNRVAGDGPGNP